MLGMDQLQHAKIHFATASEALLKQSLLTEIHNHPRQSAEGLPKYLYGDCLIVVIMTLIRGHCLVAFFFTCSSGSLPHERRFVEGFN